MKYCEKCGNEMQDDMLFCQKCGTEFKYNSKSNKCEELILNLAKTKIITDSCVHTWDAITADSVMFIKEKNNQEKAVASYIDKLNNLICEVENEQELQNKLYTLVLNTCISLCDEGIKMLRDFTDLERRFRYYDGMMDKGVFIEFETQQHCLRMEDEKYEQYAILQIIYAARIKEVLDSKVILADNELRDFNCKLFRKYDAAWNVCERRTVKFFKESVKDTFKKFWDLWSIFVSGCMKIDIATDVRLNLKFHFDENIRLNGESKYNVDYYNSINNEFLSSLKEEDDEYWKKHIEKKEPYDNVEKRREVLLEKLQGVKDSITSINKQVEEKNHKISVLKMDTQNMKRKIDELKSKRLGKTKALQEIKFIEEEVEKKEKQIQAEQEQLDKSKVEIENNTEEKNKLSAQIDKCIEAKRKLRGQVMEWELIR